MNSQFAALDALPTPKENPYVVGRREFAERYAELVTSAAKWRAVALCAIGVALVAVLGVVYIGSQSKIVPHVVHVDRLGNAVSVGRAIPAGGMEPMIVRAQIARWLYASRVVYVDAGAQRAAVEESYSMVSRGSVAHRELTDYYRATPPFERATTEIVSPRVHTALPLSTNSWRIEWTEVVRARSGEVIREDEWQAAVTVEVKPATAETTEETVTRNPLGIYVSEFSWTKRIAQENRP